MDSKTLLWAAALIAGELLFVIVAVIVYYLFKNKAKSPSAKPAEKPDEPIATAYIDLHYWEHEISRTKDALLTRNEKALDDIENLDLLTLNLRLEILQLEQKIAQTEPDKRIIDTIESDVKNILRRFRILNALKLLDKNRDEHADQETRELIEHQKKTIAFLKKYTREILDKILHQNEEFLNSKHDPEDVDKLSNAHNEFLEQSESLMEKMHQLESYNQELTQCVAILEDENQFLRDQIASLLKLTDAKLSAE